jgi:hypothetical protein
MLHPLLADRRRLAAWIAVSVPLTVVTVGLLMRGPSALPLVPSMAIAIPMSIAGVGLLLPVWYLCRALPVEATPWARLMATHGSGAALTSVAWAYLGTGLARLVAAYRPDAQLPALYQAHAPAVMAGGAILYVLAAFFHYVLLALDSARRAEQQSMELVILAREAELKALKAQVHPHFLFNSLNSISSLVATEPAQAREMCILLAEFFRRSLALGEKASVSLEEELAVAQTYLAIERLRLGSRLCVEEAVEEAARACRLPPLLLQPLVENAVRHGIATRAEGGVLRIEAKTTGQKLRLSVENPFDPEAPARPGVGLGLSNVRRRLSARYREEALLDVHRSEGHFRVSVLMPAEVEG